MGDRPAAGPPPGWSYEPTTDLSWRALAACRDLEPAEADRLLYPQMPTGGGAADRRWDEGRALCASCPVAAACLNWALTTGEEHGMWGGVTEGERAELRVRVGRPARGLKVVPELVGVPNDARTHGTHAAYKYHLRLGETPCRMCRDGNNDYQRRWKQRAAAS